MIIDDNKEVKWTIFPRKMKGKGNILTFHNILQNKIWKKKIINKSNNLFNYLQIIMKH